jgi:hypothetical protein
MFSPHSQPALNDKWTTAGKENWRKVAEILRELKGNWLYEGEKALLSTRTDKRNKAESYIRALPFAVPFHPTFPTMTAHGPLTDQ